MKTLQPAVCMPSLIVQWPARSYHFELLRMMVKLAYRLGKEALAKPVGRSFSVVFSYLLRDVVTSTYLARPRRCHVQDVVHFVFSVIPSPKDALRLPRKVRPKFHYPLFRKETSYLEIQFYSLPPSTPHSRLPSCRELTQFPDGQTNRYSNTQR